jgi:hypothetical protein
MMAIKRDLVIAETMKATDHLTGTVSRKGKVVGFSESLRDGRAASGDRQPSGSLDYTFTGPTPKGEDGSLETCRTLVRVLNAKHPIWREPQELVPPPNDIDCRVTRLDGQSPTLDIQVVRAFSDPAFWQNVHRTGRGDGMSVSTHELAHALRKAIELKADKIPPRTKSNLVLALSALDSPVVAFDSVVEEFRNQFAIWAAAQGFLQIWLVGPNGMLTHQLA